ncbi:MAG: hypothetical protein ACREJC_20490 [Tepidisphaeraceae bacterium]
MAEQARVDSIDALKSFKVALHKFVEAGNVALSDAGSEISRVLSWLENEQLSHWQSQIRKRAADVEKCKEAVRMKKLFKDATGARQSVVDEEKALSKALAALAEAEQKLANTKRHGRRLQKEMLMYKGQVQRFATTLEVEIPLAAAQLEQMVIALEQYTGYSTPGAAKSAALGGETIPKPEDEKPEA